MFPLIALFLVCGFCSACVLSLTLFISSFVWKSWVVRWLSPLPVVFILLVIGSLYAVAIFREPEWNPVIRDDSEIVGVWTEGDMRLQLGADHRFVYRDAGKVSQGHWRRDDWNIYLSTDQDLGADPKFTMRVIRAEGSYWIMPKDPGDPDSWDGDYGLSRER